ncbi:hypothetical protein TBLA_0B09330 [Henningerozyma blattae CBS 6284]|uniref:Aspartate aminotransferase n=1 Tax=Henningerozyma blattae (strain ATCC 34711 / CBS 6284 / DSM 70876 / NBRC 10599 / NRRL Y-10934 / UCD 77-7) TaxID=1071380 RepID=I2H048_HENB6|nr:hypothetical protein TBLA_0B09330 [Tetrapisispora blattae CBS 6284]CCH59750.1 hypothetical protein TBLA_0B09330 [Tetrapisispora blattae CBS 6284]
MSDSLFEKFEALPPDALFAIKARCDADARPQKVDLGIGAYRDNNGKPWVLPSVKMSELQYSQDPSHNHEYQPIAGNAVLGEDAAKILLGVDLYEKDKTVSTQTLSGTGALHVAAQLIYKGDPTREVYLSNPTWANHRNIFESSHLQLKTYPYWKEDTKTLDIDGWLKTIEAAKKGSVFVLHACAHNPTGMDPTPEEWEQVLDAMAKYHHIALFDSAYQGFASGDLDRDAKAIRLGHAKLSKQSPIIICQSFSKNLGLYGERIGCLHIVNPTSASKANIISQLSTLTRSEYSNPPAYGADIASRILSQHELRDQWYIDMKTMSSRIYKMRVELRNHLVALKTPGNWDHIEKQCGMFSFTGLTPEMVERLETKHAVYMAKNGRASVAGLNTSNVEYVAKSIDEVVHFFSS